MLAHHIPQHVLDVGERLVSVDVREPQLDQDCADVLVFALYRAAGAIIQERTEGLIVGRLDVRHPSKFRSQHIEIVSNSGFDLQSAPIARHRLYQFRSDFVPNRARRMIDGLAGTSPANFHLFFITSVEVTTTGPEK